MKNINKTTTNPDLIKLSSEILKNCRKCGSTLIVDRDMQICIVNGCDGTLKEINEVKDGKRG